MDADFNLTTTAHRIKLLRTRKNLTRTDVAKALFVQRVTYASYENAIRQPPLEVIASLCSYYSVSADFLLGLSDFENGSGGTTRELADMADVLFVSRTMTPEQKRIVNELFQQESFIEAINAIAKVEELSYWPVLAQGDMAPFLLHILSDNFLRKNVDLHKYPADTIKLILDGSIKKATDTLQECVLSLSSLSAMQQRLNHIESEIWRWRRELCEQANPSWLQPFDIQGVSLLEHVLGSTVMDPPTEVLQDKEKLLKILDSDETLSLLTEEAKRLTREIRKTSRVNAEQLKRFKTSYGMNAASAQEIEADYYESLQVDEEFAFMKACMKKDKQAAKRKNPEDCSSSLNPSGGSSTAGMK